MKASKSFYKRATDQGTEVEKRTVSVHIIDISWLTRKDGGIKNLCEKLNEIQNPDVKESEVVVCIIEKFWNDTYMVIFRQAVVPNLVYSVLVLIYYMYFLTEPVPDKIMNRLGEPECRTHFILLVFIAIFWAIAVFEEIRQFFGD